MGGDERPGEGKRRKKTDQEKKGRHEGAQQLEEGQEREIDDGKPRGDELEWRCRLLLLAVDFVQEILFG